MGKERTFIFVGTRKGVMGNEKDADVYDTPGDPIPGWEENIARIKLMKGYEKVEVFEAGESTIYERLRKRSYRQVSKGRFFFYHRGYVDGVKDALNAVAEDERKVG